MLYENEHRLGSDKCAQDARDRQNQYLNSYRTFNMFPTNVPKECKQDDIKEFSLNNRRSYFDGYGSVNACTVDQDSKVRYGWEWSTMRGRNQLPKRVFTAAPDLAHGGFNADIEDRVKQGDDTNTKRTCGPLSEVSLYEYHTIPMLSCISQTIQDPNHIVPPWQWGGRDTRDSVNQKAFLESQGYMFDGFAWKKKACGAPMVTNTSPM